MNTLIAGGAGFINSYGSRMRLDALLCSDIEGPVHLGNPEEVTLLETAERIFRLAGSRDRIVFRPLPEDDPKRRRPDISRAEALPGWFPRTSSSTGLEPTVRDIALRVRVGGSTPPAHLRTAPMETMIPAWTAASHAG